jgi:hypothetical protein
MTVREGVVLSIWIALILVATLRLPRYWRGEPPVDIERNLRRFWPYSEAALQGWLRALTAAYIAAWFMLFGMLAIVLVPSADQSAGPIVAWIVLASIAGTVAMVAIAASIIMFNWPKRLVFPALREQEGLLSRWWRLRRNRPPADES